MKTFILRADGLSPCDPPPCNRIPSTSEYVFSSHLADDHSSGSPRRRVWLPLSVLAAVLLAGCGGGASDTDSEPARGAASPETQAETQAASSRAAEPAAAASEPSATSATESSQAEAESAGSNDTGPALVRSPAPASPPASQPASAEAATPAGELEYDSGTSTSSGQATAEESPSSSGSEVASSPAPEPATETANEPATGPTADNDSEAASAEQGNSPAQAESASEVSDNTDTRNAASKPEHEQEPDQDTEQELSASSEKEISDPSSPDYRENKGGDGDVEMTVDSEPAYKESARQTTFESNNSPGFTGHLLANNTIQLRWNADSQARGYNVYRQAKYIATVFDTTYTEPEASADGNYYYEIEAFKPPNDALYRIAKGLTVEVGSAQTGNQPSAALPSMLSSDYQLVFADEFTGSRLDESKWNTRFLWGTDKIINNEVQYYVDTVNDPDFGYDPFLFDGEHLTIRGVPTPEHLKKKANNQPYLSGILTSYDSFKFTYGYAEIRAKMPYGQGLWPAFWLLNAYYNDRRPEIDIMEFIGHDQDAAHHTYHYFDYSDQLRSTKLSPTVGMDFTHDFHTFSALWKPGSIVFYVDGVQRQRVDDANVSHEQMYVLLNLAMGGWWAGDPSNETPFPVDYVVDYVRVYQGNPQQDGFGLADGTETTVPLASDSLGSTPNHLPGREDWPEGYPH